MIVKKTLTAVCLAAGLLVAPLQPSREIANVGTRPALAAECRLEIEVCQEIDLIFYKTRACWTIRFGCD